MVDDSDETCAAEALPPPPDRLPVEEVIERLRLRIAYAHRTLGISIERLAHAAGLSASGLRHYQSSRWNPKARTMLKVDSFLEDELRLPTDPSGQAGTLPAASRPE